MTQAERFDYILKLEAESREQRVKCDLAVAKRKIEQETFNAQVSIITAQLTIMNTAVILAVKI